MTPRALELAEALRTIGMSVRTDEAAGTITVAIKGDHMEALMEAHERLGEHGDDGGQWSMTTQAGPNGDTLVVISDASGNPRTLGAERG